MRPNPHSRRALLLGLAGLGLFGLSGCAAFNYAADDAPHARAAPQPLAPAPRLALVLGSGGPLTVFDPSPFADRGWIHGQKLQDYVNSSLSGLRLEQLQRRVIVVATERSNKSARYFTAGNSGVAVRASSAMPGIISPVGINGVEYEDGDESLPLAVSAARAAGARFVLAVDVSAHAGATPADAPESMRRRDTLRRARIEPEAALADFLIHPDLGYWAGPRRSFFVKSRRIGEAAAREALPALTAKLREAASRDPVTLARDTIMEPLRT